MPSKKEIAAAKKAAKRKLQNFKQNRNKQSPSKGKPKVKQNEIEINARTTKIFEMELPEKSEQFVLISSGLEHSTTKSTENSEPVKFNTQEILNRPSCISESDLKLDNLEDVVVNAYTEELNKGNESPVIIGKMPLLIEERKNENIQTNTEYNKVEETSRGFFKIEDINENSPSSASTGTLCQISSKLNGLAFKTDEVKSLQTNSHTQIVITQLEHRNQQLAEEIACLTHQEQDLKLQIENLAHQIKSSYSQFESEKQELYTKTMKEQTMLQQQLQVQMQTIGILVAEKQELQHQLHEIRTSAERFQLTKQQYNEQLQDYKVQVQTLEREKRTSEDNIKYLTMIKSSLEKERNGLQTSLNGVQRSNEENKMYANELVQKLATKDSECIQLSEEANDLNEKLAMAEVLLQQLANKNDESPNSQIEKFQCERESLNQKLLEYQRIFDELTSERDQLGKQYDEVHAQMRLQILELNTQVTTLNNKNKSLNVENEILSSKLSFLKDDTELNTIQKKVIGLETNVSDLTYQLHATSNDKSQVVQQLQNQIKNNEHLARLNETQQSKLNKLSENMNKSLISKDEYKRLLEQTQSDQSTISRALQQNKQLKNQLKEMQESFIKLTNDKIKLSNQVSSLEHSNCELETKLQITNKNLKDVNTNYEKHFLGINQEKKNEIHLKQSICDKAEYKEKLNALQENINVLGKENQELKNIVTSLKHKIDSNKGDDSEVARLQTSISELTQEKDLLKAELDSLISTDLENMILLQDKFSVVMKEKIEAISRVEDLEHINLQLQNECDTIGEYITLYHNQRQLLKQRHHEKDEYVSSMAQDRQLMQEKLEKLQSLVIRLLNSQNETQPIEGEVTKLTTGDKSSNWPDMVENKEPQPSKPDILPDSVNMKSRLLDVSGRKLRCDSDSTTANEIIDLIEEIQAPAHMGNPFDAPHGFCLRYMGKYTSI